MLDLSQWSDLSTILANIVVILGTLAGLWLAARMSRRE